MVYSMSTPAWKKRQNQNKHLVAKQKRAHQKMFEVDPNYKKEFKPLKWNVAPIRETQHVPSVSTMRGNTAKVESKQYTGDYVVGIATMHKSNLVPVCRDDNPEHYSTMRRN